MPRANKFGSEQKFVSLTCQHKTLPSGYGIILDGPKLLDDHEPGLNESYVVRVRWDDDEQTMWINVTHLTIFFNRWLNK